MPVSSAYLDYVHELLEPLGAVQTRRFFSGMGLYLDATIFGFIVQDVLYFKVDIETRPRFQSEDSGAFTYESRSGTRIIDGYWRAPERLFDEPDDMLAFARLAISASRRAAIKKKPATKRTASKAKAKARKPAASKGIRDNK